MLIGVLLFSELTVEKLAAHGIGPEEVRQVSDGDRVVLANPRPRVAGSVLMIGPTYGGRLLTVVLNPDALDDGIWHVRSAWPAKPGADSPLPTRPLREHDVTMEHDDEITSEQLDDLLDEAPTLDAGRSDGPTEVRLTVVVDAETLHELEVRAATEGTDLSTAAAGALRAGAHAA